jgi:predicted amidophosphoribosyltransferase
MDPRTKAIDDVKEIFSRAPSGPPPRVCPSCGAEHATNRAECPSCGKRYDRRFARVNDTRLATSSSPRSRARSSSTPTRA